MKKISSLAVISIFLLAYMPANAFTMYGNSAGIGPDLVSQLDISGSPLAGTLVQNFNVSNGNGRGVVVVGNILYSTQVGDPNIYKTDLTTGLPLGSITTNVASMSTLAWDGSTFWTSDYTGNNNAYQIDINGNTLKTIQLSFAGNNYDGMEYFNGKLIANRGDAATGPYDVYDLDGNLLQAAFITTTGSSTGIAFDGTYFYTSNVFAGTLSQWDGTTGAFIADIPLSGNGYGFLIEDLSVDYAQRPGTGSPVPEPVTLLLLGVGLMGITGYGRKKLS
jgi:hypothetical protein